MSEAAESEGPAFAQVRSHIVDVLARDPRVAFALLFGSRASGLGRNYSDYDVAVYLDAALPAEDRFRVRCELAGRLETPDTEIDLVILNDAPPLLAHRALQGQRLLVRDETAYVRFYVLSLRLAEDARYHRRAYDAALKARLAAM